MHEGFVGLAVLKWTFDQVQVAEGVEMVNPETSGRKLETSTM